MKTTTRGIATLEQDIRRAKKLSRCASVDLGMRGKEQAEQLRAMLTGAYAAIKWEVRLCPLPAGIQVNVVAPGVSQKKLESALFYVLASLALRS